MNTSPLSGLEAALVSIPDDFRAKLISTYSKAKDAYTKGQYDACGLRAGKFCEVMLRYLQHHLTGTYTPFRSALGNFTNECRLLEQLPRTAGSESLRIIIPRAIDFIYTLRNKRSIGHVGGDVDANEIDAITAIRGIDWCLAELIRAVHSVSLEEAQEVLDAIATRDIPAVWAVSGVKRVLNPKLNVSDQTLLLLYSDPDAAVPVEDIAQWVGVTHLSNYKRTLRSLHQRRLVEYDISTQTLTLSPTGKVLGETLLKTEVNRSGS